MPMEISSASIGRPPRGAPGPTRALTASTCGGNGEDPMGSAPPYSSLIRCRISAPEQAKLRKVTDVFVLRFSNALAASDGPLLADRWHRRSCHCTGRLTFVTVGSRWRLMPMLYEPGTSGFPSPEASESPIET